MRKLHYDGSQGESYKKDLASPPIKLLEEGSYIGIVKEITEPKISKSGKYNMIIYFDIVGHRDVMLPYYIQSDAQGNILNTFAGKGKWNAFCEAIGITEGDYSAEAFAQTACMIHVKRTDTWVNIDKLWQCNAEENDKAIEWITKNS